MFVVLLFVGNFIGTHLPLSDVACALVQRSHLDDDVKGMLLVHFVHSGQTKNRVQKIFGQENEPMKIATGPLLDGIWYYSDFRVRISFDLDGKVSSVAITRSVLLPCKK